MPSIGPNAKLRVQGMEEHDVGSFSAEITKEKTPYFPIGKDEYETATTGPAAYTVTMEVQTNSSGSTAIDWNAWCLDDAEYPVVCTNGTRTLRAFDVMIDSVSEAVEREAGTWTLSINGKCKRIALD